MRRFKCDFLSNMPDLHVWYKSAERKIVKTNLE